MSLLQLVRVSVGAVGVKPGKVCMLATQSLTVITTAGFLNGVGNQLPEVNLSPLDVIECMYSYDTVLGTASFALLVPTFSNGVITLSTWVDAANVLLPVVSGNFAVFNGTSGQIKDALYAPSNAAKTVVAMVGSAVVLNRIAHFVDTSGTIDDTAAAVTNAGDIYAGLDAVSGGFRSYPATTATGYLALIGVSNSGAFNTTISNAPMGQSSTVNIPDPGVATSKFVLQDGVNTVVSIANLKYGATPVAQVDPASCTITAAAGASNTATVTVQLKDGSGTNMARIIPFRIYASSAADGLTLASAASTGFSVASGGLSLQNGAAITTQINAISSATGGCVLSLLDTGKQTSYLVLVLANGTKISAQLSAGSYGA